MRGGRKQPSVFRLAVREGQKYLEGKRNLCDSFRALFKLSTSLYNLISTQTEPRFYFLSVSPHYVFYRLCLDVCFWVFFSTYLLLSESGSLRNIRGRTGHFFNQQDFVPFEKLHVCMNA